MNKSCCGYTHTHHPKVFICHEPNHAHGRTHAASANIVHETKRGTYGQTEVKR